MRYANGFDAEEHLRSVVGRDATDAFVELGPRHGTAGRRERRAWPFHLDVGTEARHPQTPVADRAVQPRAEAEQLEFGYRTRVSGRRRTPCPWGTAGSRSPVPRGRRRTVHAAAAEPAGPGADHDHVTFLAIPGRCARALRIAVHSSQYVGAMKTPATVVAGVDFGDATFADQCSRRSGAHRRPDGNGAGQGRRADGRGGPAPVPGRRQAVSPAVHGVVGPAGSRSRMPGR